MRKLLLAMLLSVSAASSVADPRSHYMIHCMGCHLSDGSGSPPDVPGFDSELLELMTTEHGRAYLVQVPGASQSPISDDDLAAVINWILREYAGLDSSGTIAPLSGQEVTQYRSRILLDPVKTRANMSPD